MRPSCEMTLSVFIVFPVWNFMNFVYLPVIYTILNWRIGGASHLRMDVQTNRLLDIHPLRKNKYDNKIKQAMIL